MHAGILLPMLHWVRSDAELAGVLDAPTGMKERTVSSQPPGYGQNPYEQQPGYPDTSYPSQSPQQPPTYPSQGQYPPQQAYPLPPQAYPSQGPQGTYYGTPTPYPPQQSAYPQPYPAQPMVVTTYTRSTSFTNKAVISFLLYFMGWLPGIIFNVMYLNEANNVKKELGRTPEGMGCLWATLAGGIVPLIGFCVICALMSAAMGGTTAHP